MPRLSSLSSRSLNGQVANSALQSSGVYEQVSGTLLTLPSGVTRSTTQLKYGTASLAFAGTSALTYTFATAFQTSSQGATLEAWVWTDPTTTNAFNLMGSQNSNGGGQSFQTGHAANGNTFYGWGNGVEGAGGNNSATVSQWHHFAIYGANNQIEAWLDGTRIASQSADPYPQSANKIYLHLGGRPIFSQWWKGFMSDIRVSSGDRYANALTFNPPTTKLTVDGTTLALIQAV
jgi:hypothetical protein